MASQQKLHESIKRAKALIDSQSFNEKVSAAELSMRNNGNIPTYNSKNSHIRNNTNSSPIVNDYVMENSKLPKEILQSFRTKQIDDPITLETNSVLDVIGLSDSTHTSKKEMTETITAKPSSQNTMPIVQSGSISVDYSLIKALIDESVQRNLKQIITENKESMNSPVISIGKGNKIQFIDPKGNLYEGKLIYKGNISDNK